MLVPEMEGYIRTFASEIISEGRDCWVDLIGHNVKNETVAVRLPHNPWFLVNAFSEEVCNEVDSFLRSELYEGTILSTQVIRKNNSQGYSKENFCYCLKVTLRSMKSYYYAMKKLRSEGSTALPNNNYQCFRFKNNKVIQLEIAVDQKLKFLLDNKLKKNQWLRLEHLDEGQDYGTRFKHHYRGKFDQISVVEDRAILSILPNTQPKIFSYDGEMYSSTFISEDVRPMPKASLPKDDAYLFTVCIALGTEILRKYAFTHITHHYVPKKDEVIIRTNDMEETILSLFNYIKKEDPDILLGHNIYGWDNSFIDTKMSDNLIDMPNFSRYNGESCDLQDDSWGSSAHRKMEVIYFKCKGRIWMDMLPYTKRYHKLRSYSLKFLSKTFLDLHKIDLSPEEQFKLYEAGDITRTIEYGLVDCIIPVLLFNKFGCWNNLLADSNIRNIDIFDIYSKGQGVGGFNQTYTEVHGGDYFMTGLMRLASFGYKGALVLQALMGYYRYIMTFDFSGMYPSIMMAYNICFSTLVTDPSIPDWMCHIFDIPNDKDPSKPPTRYRFIKKEYREGILPKFLRKNKEARKQVKEKQKLVPYKSFEWEMLELEQLNIKLSSNGVYGLLGSPDSKFFCLPAAECVTFTGRVSIDKVKNYMKDVWNALVVTGDSDSVMVHIPGIEKYMDNIEIIGQAIAGEISKQFPEDIVIEFEKMWEHFILFSKKHYMGYLADFKNLGKVEFTSMENKHFQAKGIIKRDTPEAIQEMMLAMGNSVFQNGVNAKEIIIGVYRDYVTKLETIPIDKMLASVEIGDIDSYKLSTNSSYIFYNNMKAKGRILKMGDRVEYFLQAQEPGQPPYKYKGDKMNLSDNYVQGKTKLDYASYIDLFEKKAMKVIMATNPLYKDDIRAITKQAKLQYK